MYQCAALAVRVQQEGCEKIFLLLLLACLPHQRLDPGIIVVGVDGNLLEGTRGI